MSESALINSCFEEIASHAGKYFPAKESVEYKERKKQFTKTCKLLLKEVAAEQEEEEEELQVKAKPKKKSTQRKHDEAELGEPLSKKKVKIGADDKKKSVKKKSSTGKKSKK